MTVTFSARIQQSNDSECYNRVCTVENLAIVCRVVILGRFVCLDRFGAPGGVVTGRRSQVAILLLSSRPGTLADYRLDGCGLQEVCQVWLSYYCFMTL